MSEQRERPLQGWGRTDPHRGTWRRNRDWIGRHTIAAAILGGALAALIGYAAVTFIDPLSATPQGDIEAIENEAMQRSYAAAWEDALAVATADARTEALAALIIEGGQSDQTADAPWALGFREGWAAGWNEALEAMRNASEEAGYSERAPEFYILESAQRR